VLKFQICILSGLAYSNIWGTRFYVFKYYIIFVFKINFSLINLSEIRYIYFDNCCCSFVHVVHSNCNYAFLKMFYIFKIVTHLICAARGVCVILFIGAKHVGNMTSPLNARAKNTNAQCTQCKQKPNSEREREREREREVLRQQQCDVNCWPSQKEKRLRRQRRDNSWQ